MTRTARGRSALTSLAALTALSSTLDIFTVLTGRTQSEVSKRSSRTGRWCWWGTTKSTHLRQGRLVSSMGRRLSGGTNWCALLCKLTEVGLLLWDKLLKLRQLTKLLGSERILTRQNSHVCVLLLNIHHLLLLSLQKLNLLLKLKLLHYTSSVKKKQNTYYT